MGLIYQSKDTSWVTVFENNEQYTLGKELHQEYIQRTERGGNLFQSEWNLNISRSNNTNI